MDHSKRQDLRGPRTTVAKVHTTVEGPDPGEGVDQTGPQVDAHTLVLNTAVPTSVVKPGEARKSDDERPEDRTLASAVDSFRGELSSAFDSVPHLGNQDSTVIASEAQTESIASSRVAFPKIDQRDSDDGAHSPQSEGGSSDFDQMITLLPLASHFDISRRKDNSARIPRRLSADSRYNENRTSRPEDSKSVSSTRPQDSPSNMPLVEPVHDAAATVPSAATESDDALRIRLTIETMPPSAVPILPSVKSKNRDGSINNQSPSPQNPNRRRSTDSDLYTSSITEKKPRKPQSLKRPSSTDSDLHTSSVTMKKQPHRTLSGGAADQEIAETAKGPSVLTNDTNERVAHSATPPAPIVSDRDVIGTGNVSQSTAITVNGYPTPPALPETAPPNLPQSQPSPSHPASPDDLQAQAIRRRSATTGEQREPRIARKPVFANSLRRNDLVSSDYVKYSNAEQHGLKIILTPEAGTKPEEPRISSFTAPPARQPPPIPPSSTNSLSTLSPTTSLTLGPRQSNESSPSRNLIAGPVTTSPIEREESINETLSTMSSSDRSDRQSLSSLMTSASNTVATSFPNPPDTLRGQAQSELHKLQLELTAAKSRGDTTAQKASLQRSMDIIQKTYLSAEATKSVESGSTPSRARTNRISLVHKKSMSLLSMVNRKARQTDLHEAARTGDIDALTSLLEEKINPNARGDEFKTPQMEAAIRSHLQCLDVLKAYGADEFAINAQGSNVLHIAVMFNQPKAVSWLIQSYPPSAPDMPGRRSSRLAWATEAITGSRSSKILREASDGEGSRPLHVAAKRGMATMVSLLLDNGSDIEAKDNWGRTSLIDAAMLNRLEIVELLLERGADITIKDVKGMTALHWAAEHNHLSVLKVLLMKGNACFSNRNWMHKSFTEDGDLAIHVAARKGHTQSVELLKGSRQVPGLLTKHGETLVHITALANQLDLTRELLRDKADADVNAWAKPFSYHLRPDIGGGYSKKALPLPYNIIPLHYACTRGYYEMTELLLENGAWVNAVPDDDDHGKSPLMMAVESGNVNLVCLLLARGAKVNAAVAATLVTALHLACKRGDIETTQELVRYGAKTAARTKDMRTPEELIAKVEDSKKRKAMEAYFAALTKERYARIKAQMVENRRQGTEPSLTPQPSPTPVVHQAQPMSYVQYPREFLDPENDAFPDAPPAYTPGPRAPQNLVNRPGVHRPGYE